MEKFTCSRGYSNSFSGFTVAIVTFVGIFGTFSLGYLTNKTEKLQEIIKFGGLAANIFGLLFLQVLRKPDMEWEIILVAALFAFFILGIFTLCLELNVELTYPIEQAIGMALTILISNIVGSIFTLISEPLANDLCGEAIKIQTCEPDSDGNATGKDHTYFLMFLSGYLTIIISALVIFVNGEYKRRIANKS